MDRHAIVAIVAVVHRAFVDSGPRADHRSPSRRIGREALAFLRAEEFAVGHHRHLLRVRLVQAAQNGLLLTPVLHVDAPVVQLLDEVVLGVLLAELRVELPVVAQVVHERLEGVAIPVEEDLVVDLLQLVHV